jgi:DNA recombination protein RmuC
MDQTCLKQCPASQAHGIKRTEARHVRAAVEKKLKDLQEDNTKLDLMRATVDEKLQSTLERRLGESFKQV